MSGTTELVSVNVTGTDAGHESYEALNMAPAFSPDSQKIAFYSRASDLVVGDTNDARDVFVRDLATDITTMVSTNAAGTDSANGGSTNPVFSADGTRIAFSSTSTDLGFTDTNIRGDVFVRDLRGGTLSLVTSSAADATRTARGLSTLATWPGGNFSPDGRQILVQSSATDLDPLKRDNDLDIFIASTSGT